MVFKALFPAVLQALILLAAASHAASLKITDEKAWRSKLAKELPAVESEQEELREQSGRLWNEWTQRRSGTMSPDELKKWEPEISAYKARLARLDRNIADLEASWGRVSDFARPSESRTFGSKMEAFRKNLADTRQKMLWIVNGIDTYKFLAEKEPPRAPQSAAAPEEGMAVKLKKKLSASLDDWGMKGMKKTLSLPDSEKEARKKKITQLKLEYLRRMIKHQKDLFDAYPVRLEDLMTTEVKGILAESNPLKDAWGKDIQYANEPPSPVLISMGGDGALGTEDDLKAEAGDQARPPE